MLKLQGVRAFCSNGNNDFNACGGPIANEKPPGRLPRGLKERACRPGLTAGLESSQAEPLMFSGENGRVRQRLPLAAKIALPMAG